MFRTDRASLVQRALMMFVATALAVPVWALAEGSPQNQPAPQAQTPAPGATTTQATPSQPASAPGQPTVNPQGATPQSGMGKMNMPDTSRAAIQAQIQRRVNEMGEQLKLSPQQREQLKPIIQQQMDETRALHAKQPRIRQRHRRLDREIRASRLQ